MKGKERKGKGKEKYIEKKGKSRILSNIAQGLKHIPFFSVKNFPNK